MGEGLGKWPGGGDPPLEANRAMLRRLPSRSHATEADGWNFNVITIHPSFFLTLLPSLPSLPPPLPPSLPTIRCDYHQAINRLSCQIRGT